MSIIERVADLLGTVSQTRQKPSAEGEGTDALELDLIERATGDKSRRLDLPVDKDLGVVSMATEEPARSTSRTARTLKVDRDRLRRQSMITPDGERTPITESFRRIKRQILANLANPEIDAPSANLVMVTSALPGGGKTFCTINLAISIAQEMDHTVLLVDADVAKPSIPLALGLKTEMGLMNVLLDRKINLAEVLWKTDIDKLTLLPAGTARHYTTEMLASAAMRALLREMAARYKDRIVIFDSPPLLATSEASVLASQMGQIVVVVEAGKTSEAALKDALSHIDSSKVTGLLLNKGEKPALGYGYGGYG